MKNYLVRAGQSPFDMFGIEEVITRNSIGGNSGNLLYAQSVFRTLMVGEDTNLVPNYYRYAPLSPARVNEHFDAFIIPLADAFRPNYPELINMTEFIERLTIPCVVIGVGLRAPFDYTPGRHFDFDDDVKRFVKAVLKRSAKIGVRGEITSAYLSSLGFKEGQDHTVIGCPSMYTFGRELQVKDVPQSYDAHVCVNATVTSNITRANNFIFKEARKFADYHFLPQLHSEYVLNYAGMRYKHKKTGYYPDSLMSAEMREGRILTFNNARAWSDFTSTVDFSFGGRLHGNIGALLGGTPGLLFTKDARTRELADYHQLPSIPEVAIEEDASIFDYIEKADFSTYKKIHPENFDRYTHFLDENGLDHIYNHGFERGSAPFDIKMERIYSPDPTPNACAFNEVDISARMEKVVENEYKQAPVKARAVAMAYGLKRYSSKEIEFAEKILATQEKLANLQGQFEILRQRYQDHLKKGIATDAEVEEMGVVADQLIAEKKKISDTYPEIMPSTKLFFRIIAFRGIIARKKAALDFARETFNRKAR